MNFFWQKPAPKRIEVDFNPLGIISIDQHESNSDTNDRSVANVYRAVEIFNNGALDIKKEIVPVAEAQQLIEDGDFLSITAKGWGIDVINTDHFSYAAMGYQTDEWHDQTLLIPVFDFGKNIGDAGVPYSAADEDLTVRLPDWINVRLGSGHVLRVNPKYLPEELQPNQTFELPTQGKLQEFKFYSFAAPSIRAFDRG